MADEYVSVANTPRGILQHFTTHEATAPQRAMGFNPTQDSETQLFRQLRAEGVIREASPNLFYVDEARLARRQTEALTRVLTVGGVAGVLIAGAATLRSRRHRRAERRRAQAASVN